MRKTAVKSMAVAVTVTGGSPMPTIQVPNYCFAHRGTQWDSNNERIKENKFILAL
jgi:hypothetical protein